MKLKNSFFNKTLFQKNVTMFWPVWTVYTIVVMCMHPALLWMYMTRNLSLPTTTKTNVLLETLHITPLIGVIVCAAVVLGMCLYNYLYNNKSANMIHALPVDRKQLFGTNVISGLTFLIFPLLIAAGIMTLIAMIFAIPNIELIWIWFLLVAGIAFTMFGVVTFCAMFTGHIVTVPVFFFIFNYLSKWVYYLVYLIVVAFGYGVSGLSREYAVFSTYFSPLECMMENVNTTIWAYDYVNPEKIGFVGEKFVLIYCVVAVFLYVFAYIAYQKRHIESVGSFITANWLKVVFRWGAGVTTGIFGAIFLKEVFYMFYIPMGTGLFVFIMLLLGVIGYFAAEMFVSKNFKVFKKKNFINCGLFVAALLVSFFGVYGISEKLETVVPEKEDILYVTFSSGYSMDLDGEEVETILEIHKAILENKDYCETNQSAKDNVYVHIAYYLKDGSEIRRNYHIPKSEKTQSIFDKVEELELDGENFIKSIFGISYEMLDTFGEGKFVAPTGDGEYTSANLSREQVAALYEAVLADAKSGDLLKYNIYGMHEKDEISDSEVSIEFEFQYPTESSKDESANFRWAYLYFGKDCENIVNKLIELKVIESTEGIEW